MATEDKKKKAATQTGFYLVVLAGIAVMANVIAFGLNYRFDVTKTERYTLSQGSARLVADLNSPIEVEAYVTRGLAQLDTFVRDLTDLLKEYERAGKGKFKFTLIEAKTDEEREQAKEAGLQEMAFGETSATGSDQASIAQGYMGLVFKYGSEKGVIPQLAPGRSEGLEFWITNKIREVRDKSEDIKHRIGIITGKDELKLSDTNLVPKQGRGGAPSIQSILEQAFPFYKIENVDLKDGEEAIDAELDGVMITQPRKDYSDKELRRIDEFLMRGNKSLVVYASAVGLKPQDASMTASLNWHNLDKLLTGYGLGVKKNAILDHGAQFRLPIMTATGGISSIRHPGIAHVINDPRFSDDEKLLDTGFAGFFRMDEIAFPFPSSIELLKDKQGDDVKIYAVARSTPAASVHEGESMDMKLQPEWKPKPPYGQHIIAAVAEGNLKAALGEGDGVSMPAKAAEPSRVLVIASSQFITNPFAYSGNGPELGGQFAMMGNIGGDQQLQMIAQPYAQRYLTNTILSVKNTLDWMSGDADLLAASAKILGDPNLTYTSIAKPNISAEDDEAAIRKKDEEYRQKRKALQQQVQWSLTLGMPVLFALFGIGRWRYRQNKKLSHKV
ncbi:MAG: GldG family protein [Polyangiaceae bacterium]|nr:GldG family protein [Polyangiaceae bacterium]